jgi:hypothetical protein
MSDDFGTISARRAREIEVLRKHRESLVKMLADVDAQLRELGEITAPVIAPPRTAPPTLPDRDSIDSRPIVNTAAGYDEPDESIVQPGGGGGRILILAGVALLALVAIAGLIWWASKDRQPATGTVVEETTAAETETTATAADTVDAVPDPGTIAPAAAPMGVTPRSHDYGLIRKGTRATRQFTFRNDSEEPVTISVARSTCRCLYYEYGPLVPPKATETITVTVDGAKAKAGTLRETIGVTTKNGSGGTSFDVIATIR